MQDCFAVLGLQRAFWIEPDQLKEHYLAQAKAAHPDSQSASATDQDTSNQDSVEINRARDTLTNPANRIAHLVRLESGQDITRSQHVPNDLVDLFMQLSPLLQEADRLTRSLNAEASTILKAQHFVQASPLLTTLSDFSGKIDQLLEGSRNELKHWDAEWQSYDASTRSDQATAKIVNELYARFAYLQKWRDQIAEKSFGLTPM